MIETEKLKDCNGIDMYGTCGSCGKESEQDNGMVRITVKRRLHSSIGASYHGTSICLCRACQRKLWEML